MKHRMPNWFTVDALILVFGFATLAATVVGLAYLDRFKQDPRCEPWCKATISAVQKLPEAAHQVYDIKTHHHGPAPKATH
jgi:hypothetical protein